MATADSMPVSGLMTMGQACRYVNRHANSLRKYANSGQLPAYRVLGGQRRFEKNSLAEFFGIKNNEENINDGASVFGYCRTSSAGQSESLQRQIDAVKIYIHEHYGIGGTIYSEIGSSLNFKRPKLTKMIRDILAGKYDNGVMVLHYKDRLCRIGGELVFLLCELHNIKIVITEQNELKSDAQELAEDVASFVQIMANRMTAARGAKILRKTVKPETASRIRELRSEGKSLAYITTQLFSEGHRATDGKGEITSLGVGVIQKILAEKLQLDIKSTSVERYVTDCVDSTNPELRTEKNILYENYVSYCQTIGVKPSSMNMAGRILKNIGLKECVIHKGNIVTLAWVGAIKNAHLHVRVIPKQPYQPQKKTLQKRDGFISFINSELRGKEVRLSRGQLNSMYLSHCEAHNQKPISMRLIPQILSELGYMAKLTGKAHIYDFTTPKPD